MDVLLLALADVARDARTLNVARALAADGLDVGIVASGTLPAQDHDSITFFRWDDPGGRAWRRWWSFTRRATSLANVAAPVIGAMDLFALSAARTLKRRWHSSLVYDAREFYFALGPLDGKGMKQRIVAEHERRGIRHADVVTVSAPLDAEIVQRQYDLKERPVVVLNTPPYRDAVPSTILRERCGISSSDTIVLYQGVVHNGRGIGPMMRALPLMSDVHFCIVGDGPATEALKQEASALGVAGRVHWLGAVPYDDLHMLTCGADIGCCLIEPVSLSYEYALPNKFFEYMMARIPSIATDLPALHRWIMQHPVGMLVGREMQPGDIVEAIRRIQVPATRDAMIRQCEDIRKLSYESQEPVIIDLYRALLERHG